MKNWGLLALILVAGCGNDENIPHPASFVPEHFPKWEDNGREKWSEAAFELGRDLFFERGLSVDSSLSCASCHHPAKAFTDGRKTSMGIHNTELKRNAPTLANVAFKPVFFAEGGVPSLERTINPPLESPEEMGINMRDLIERLAADAGYRKKFKHAYNREPDPRGLADALAAYMRALISADAPIDRHLAGDENALTPHQKKGLEVFEKSGCVSCHPPPLFTDHQFHNIGLHENYQDAGHMLLTFEPSDEGRFITPTLRNILLTGPYMHDGSLATLQDVLDFYEKGGHPHPNKDPRKKPMQWTEEDKAALLAFFEGLTDTGFTSNPIYLKN